MKNQKNKIIGLGLILFVIYGIWGTQQRNAVYATTETLWRDAVAKAPKKARTLHNLAFAYGETNQLRASKVYFNKSLQSSTRFMLARINLARVYRSMENYDQSFKEYQMITKIAPYISMQEVQSVINDAFFEQAQLHASLGEFSQVIKLFEQRPYVASWNQAKLLLAASYRELGGMALQKKNISQAFQYLNQSASLNPNDPQVFNNLGVLFANLGQINEAKRAFESALQIDPNHEQAKENLNMLLESQSQ